MKNKEILYIYILFTRNNIFFSILNFDKNLITWTTTGKNKFKGLKKINSNSIKNNINLLLFYIKELRGNVLYIKFKGLNKYKKLVLKYFKQSNACILGISDNNVIAHNGCKKKKKRKL